MNVDLGRLIEFTRSSLSGYDQSRDAVAALSSPLAADALTISIDDVGDAARGLAEIDFETVRIKQVDDQASSLLLYPFGRGYRGTSATSHEVGAEVRFNPPHAAYTVAREINGVLTELYPFVYAVRTHETVIPPDGAIDLPTTATGVLGVYVEDDRNPNQWVPEHRWSYQPDSTSIGRPLRVGGGHRSNDAVRIVYAARPGTFDPAGALTQDFETVTGLEARCADLIQLGVACRMAPFIDAGKLPFLSAEARADAESNATGTASTVSRLLYSLFKQRVEQEAAVLAKEHPIRVHMTGVI